ncbi:PE-PPE domain-containing protein [Mycobacterium sp. C31M]
MLVSRFRVLATTAGAVLLTVGLVLGVGTGISAVRSAVALVNTVIGIGGSSDPLSERLPNKLSHGVVPLGDTYIGTEYPASLNLDRSVRIGMPVLHQHLVTTSGKVLVAGYSLGALLVEQLKRDVAAAENPPSPDDLSFLQIATPFVPNGGIFARFPGIAIPDVVSPMGPGRPTQYDTTYIVNEYDLWGDFPAYFNPVSILNAVLGHEYAHIDTYYDPVDINDEANHVKVVTNTAGGVDTYILVPNKRLPLLGPLRDIAYHLGISAGAERLLSAIEPLLRVIVDMGYTDRLNLNPERRTPFSLFTPPHKIAEALRAVPDAIGEGLHNLVHGPPEPAPVPGPAAAATSETPVAARTDTSEPEPESDAETEAEAEPETDDEPAITVRKKPRTVPTVRSPRSARTAEAPKRPRQADRDAGADAA